MCKEKHRCPVTLLLLLLATVFLYVLLHDLFGGTLLEPSDYNSYTLQAMAWRNGTLQIEGDYFWLELAEYQGGQYLSFPPVPTLLMLPLTFVFGTETPDHFVALCLMLLMISGAYCTAKKTGASDNESLFFSVFLTLGSNFLWMCTDGSVWFLAQAFNMVLCLWAVFFAVGNHPAISLTAAALAVGCRPFSLLLFLPLLILFIENGKRDGLSEKKLVKRLLKAMIVPALIGASYLFYNYVRFGNPLEFGHNYLPEFSQGEPQFSFRYILQNLQYVLRPVLMNKEAGLNYPVFEGFLFFAANPFFIEPVLRGKQLRPLRPYQLAAIAAMLLNFLLLLMHRTFGGWQFGARYTADLLSYLFLLLLPVMKNRIPKGEIWLAVFAVLFNLYGAAAMHFLHA